MRYVVDFIVGISIIGPIISLDYLFSIWFRHVTGGKLAGCPWPLGMLFGILGAIMIAGALCLTLVLGSSVIDSVTQ